MVDEYLVGVLPRAKLVDCKIVLIALDEFEVIRGWELPESASLVADAAATTIASLNFGELSLEDEVATEAFALIGVQSLLSVGHRGGKAWGELGWTRVNLKANG